VVLSVLFALVVPCMGVVSCRHSSYRPILLNDSREIQQRAGRDPRLMRSASADSAITGNDTSVIRPLDISALPAASTTTTNCLVASAWFLNCAAMLQRASLPAWRSRPG
jgi:hypothetical protein